jgi:hypothetical protein
VSDSVVIDFADQTRVQNSSIHHLGSNRENSVSNWNVHVCGLFGDAAKRFYQFLKTNKEVKTHFAGTIGLPVTEETASPARACRSIENGVYGLTFGVIVFIRSVLAAFCRIPLIGVRYFDREVCGTVCCVSGVLPFVAVIIARGPGVTADATLVTDLLRRKFVFFTDAMIDLF